MQSSQRHHPRNRWAHCNTPAALRRRRALLDARREALAATLPPIPDDPEPGAVWCVVQIVGAAGVLHSRTLYVPARGHRCDQHADEAGRLVSATELGAWLRGAVPKRPSHALRAEMRRAAFAVSEG
jgi:hypothetical protein